MTIAGLANDKLPRIRCKRPKSLLLPKTSLASVESLAMPLVQEVVLSADFQCPESQKRVADVISRMTGVPSVDWAEVQSPTELAVHEITSTRIGSNTKLESVVVNVLEKKVTLTCRYPSVAKEVPTRQVTTICRKSPGKLAMFMRIFRSSYR